MAGSHVWAQPEPRTEINWAKRQLVALRVGLPKRCILILRFTTADRMAAHRKSDQLRDDLCAGGLLNVHAFNLRFISFAHRLQIGFASL